MRPNRWEADPQQMENAVRFVHDQLQETLSMQETPFLLCRRLFAAELRSYLLLSTLSFIVLLFSVYLLPEQRMRSAALYFCFLGCYTMYLTFRQSVFGMDELVSVCYLNQGRLFLYKCAVSSVLQLGAFAILMIVEAFHQGSFQELFLSTVFPLLLIQCIAFLFERLLRRSITVLLVYLFLYVFYLFLFLNRQILFIWLTGIPSWLLLPVLVLYIWIILRRSRQLRHNQKQQEFLWN